MALNKLVANKLLSAFCSLDPPGLAIRPFQCVSQTKFLIPTSTNVPRPQFSHLMNGSLFLLMALVQVGIFLDGLCFPYHCEGPEQYQDVLKGWTLTFFLLPSDYWNKAPRGTGNYPRNLMLGKERKTEAS